MISVSRVAFWAGGLCLAASGAMPSLAGAVSAPTADSVVDPGMMRIDEPKFLGRPLDGNTALVDSAGNEFRLSDMMGKPLILLLSYYGCDGTCPTINRNLANVLAAVKRFRLGNDYRVLTVSFDRQDTPGAAAAFLDKTQVIPPSMREGWRHAVLKDYVQGKASLTDAVGFRYFWSQADKMFLHPNVLVFLTPEGRVARYIYGTGMDPANIELALIDTDWGRISNSAALFDMFTGACYSYNYAEGRYQPNYSLMAGVGSLLFGLGLTALGLGIFRKTKRETAVHE